MPKSNLPNASELRDTLKISLPVAMGILASVLIGIIDTIMLGRLGSDALGAAGLAWSVYSITSMLAWGMLFPVMVRHPRPAGPVDYGPCRE